jgi:UDP-glucose 4-epimerase
MTDAPDVRRVLVTGAAGFVGANVVRRLLLSAIEVHVLLRSGAAGDPWRLRDVLDRLHVHRADLEAPAATAAAVAAAAQDVIVHCAAYGAYAHQDDWYRILQSNVLGTANLLTASARASVPLFVNAGSSSEYGYRPDPMREEDRLDPNSCYAVSKAAQTHLCTLASRVGGLAAVTFRLFSVYGPWEEPGRLMPTIIRRAMRGQPLHMGAPDVARDFVHVDDVVDALIDFSALRGRGGDVFNLGSGRQSTLREVVATLDRVLGRASVVEWNAFPARPWDTTRWQADVRRAGAELGWRARRTLEEGLRSFAEWCASPEGQRAYAHT